MVIRFFYKAHDYVKFPSGYNSVNSRGIIVGQLSDTMHGEAPTGIKEYLPFSKFVIFSLFLISIQLFKFNSNYETT